MLNELISIKSSSIAKNDVDKYRESLIQISEKVSKKLIPEKSFEKQQQLSDELRGILVLLTEKELDIFDDLWTNDKLFIHANFKKSGSMLDLWPSDFKELAKRLINITSSAIGTPNAASGKGELFFRLSSRQFEGVVTGDIKYDDGKEYKIFELKKGGKIGSKVPYKIVNEKLIIFCKTHELSSLPEAKNGKSAKGKQQFIPGSSQAEDFLGKLPKDVKKAFLKEFWNELKFSSNFPELLEYSWENVKLEIIKAAVSDHFKENRGSILVIHDNYCYNIFDNTNDFINFYKTKEIKFEIRAHQNNPLSFYVC